jgi:hypothetical protein
MAPGVTKVLFKPLAMLKRAIESKIALGKDNLAKVN